MSAPLNLFVYEYFTGGGFPAGDLPGGLAAEALGMLWAALADFRKWGAVRTVTVLDPRFEERVPGLNRNTLPADEVVCSTCMGHETVFQSLLNRCEAAIIIAPETGGILANLSAQVESAGIPLLGSSAQAVDIAGNKETCGGVFTRANLPAPETLAADVGSVLKAAAQIGFPLVVKPLDGIGSEGVCLVEDVSDMPLALESVRRSTSLGRILLQSYARGIHASVSLLTTGSLCLPLCLNRQLIRPGRPFEYLGSEVPFDHASAGHAMRLAASAANRIPGLKGYVGVDLILADDSCQLIEINPRLTTSYIGFRQVARMNPARMLYEACINGVLLESVELSGRVVVKKDDPLSWGLLE
jgi:predicted ATP-grasp superfamily ATP-dependent carboligase